MEYSQLSKDIKVSKLQFGCARLGKAVKEDTSKIGPQILQHAFENGINFFDTAANYAYGSSEKLLGEFAKGRRSEVFLVTKGGTLLSKKATVARVLKPIYNLIRPIIKKSESLRKHVKRYNFDFDFLSKTLDRSLSRMKTGYVDVYLLHSPTKDVLNNPKTADFLGSLKKDGRVRLTGHSFTHLDDLLNLASLDNIDVIQVPLNYYTFRQEHFEILNNVKEKGVKIFARSPFERGMLTTYNEVTSGRRTGMKDEALMKKKLELKTKYGVSEIQLAMWFVKDIGLADSILFSTFSKAHLDQDIAAFLEKINDDFSWKNLMT